MKTKISCLCRYFNKTSIFSYIRVRQAELLLCRKNQPDYIRILLNLVYADPSTLHFFVGGLEDRRVDSCLFFLSLSWPGLAVVLGFG